MFKRRQQQPAETPKFMDHELIGSLEGDVESTQFGGDFFVRAVLFGSGELRRLRSDTDIYGLVLAGYDGLHFGDDGTFTARLASEEPLDFDGIRRVEGELNKAIHETTTAYYAEFVGRIGTDEARVMLDVDVKRELGVEFPSNVSWSDQMGAVLSHQLRL